MKIVFTNIFWGAREDLGADKSTSHVMLEANHGLVLFYDEKEAGVPIKMGCKPLVHFLVEEMAQEPCEGCCEHS
jgi:hypothetical protein